MAWQPAHAPIVIVVACSRHNPERYCRAGEWIPCPASEVARSDQRFEPRPVRLTTWGLPVALSVRVSLPVSVPVLAGENVTLIVQPAPTARELPHVLLWANGPVVCTPLKVTGEPPVLVTVTV
jgi:hypothetical protein